MSPTPNLVSFSICPFVQRSRIVLNVKNTTYDIEYIDLANKPDWFLKRVPTGKVPAMFIDEDTVFESTVINEYLDETTPGSLLPSAPLARAQERSWITFSEGLIMAQFRTLAATTHDAYEAERDTLFAGLHSVETFLESRQDQELRIGMLEASIAPVFTRIYKVKQLQLDFEIAFNETSTMRKLANWLLEQPHIIKSVPDWFDKDFVAFFTKKNSYTVK